MNTKITTESELIGTSEYVPFNIWIVLFYEAQGYEKTKMSYFNIMKEQPIWRKMDESRAQVILYKLTFVISSLKIE